MKASIKSAEPLGPTAAVVIRRRDFHSFKVSAAARTQRKQLALLCIELSSARGAFELSVFGNHDKAHNCAGFISPRTKN